MADNISSLKIAVDSTEVKNATNNLNNLTNVSGKAEKSTTSLIGGFTKLQAGALASAAAVGALAKAGIEYNAQIEKLTNGLTTLNVLTSKNVDSNGKAISLEQKYNIARRESIETMQKLNAINLETPHTLDQTVQIYKAMYTSMKTVGVSSEEMIDLTKKLSIAAGSSGIEFQQLLSGIDGLATGTVEASSELGRFLKSIGLSNEELKKSANIYETINNKIKDVQGIIGYEEAVSNLANSFDQLTGALVEPFFDDVKNGITGLAGMFNDLTKSVTLFYDKFKSISELSTKDQLNTRAVEVATKIAEQKERLANAFDFNKGKYASELRASELELLAINQQFEAMNKLNDTKLVANGIERNQAEITKISGNELAKFNLSLDENIQKLKKAGATEEEINVFRKKSLDDFNQSQIKSTSLTKESTKSNDDLNNAIKEMSKVGLSDYSLAVQDITAKTQEWIKAGADYNEVIAKQKQLLEELNLQNSLSIASEQLSFLEKKAQLMTDEYEKSKLLLEIKHAQNLVDIQGRNIPLEDKQRLIEQETELYNLTKERIELDRNEEFRDTMLSFQDDMIERQRELNSALFEFGDTYEGVGGKISKVSKEVASFANAEIKAKKEREKIDKKYEKEFTKYAGDVEKTKVLEQKYSEETAQTNQMAIANQIEGYSNLAGAISGLYEEGSAKAQAFMIIQKALSIASGITAIASAMANGDGYTAVARGLAVAATLVSFGWKSQGGSPSSGGGKQKESQFDIREKDIENTYQPIIDRLDRQVELLESIDKKGSASAISLVGSKINFDKNYASAVNSIIRGLPNDVRGYGLDFNNSLARVESRLGFNIADVVRIKKSGWDKSEKRIYTDASSLSRGTNMIKLITDYFKTNDPNIAALFGGRGTLNQAANKIQSVIGNFTKGITSSLDDVKSASEEFKDIYDSITGTMLYENKRLNDAFSDVQKLTKGNTFADYLKDNIDQIEFLNQTFTDSVINTLLSQNPKDMAKQIEILDKLKDATGLVFENGARDALDFMESIKLVGDAMVTSSENIRDFFDSFLNDTQKLEVMASKLGETIPKSMQELMSSFARLSSDMNGLTDSDLEYLSAAKDLLIGQSDSLTDTINSLTEASNNLRNSVNGINSNSLDKFYQSMAKTQELLSSGDYEDITQSINETIGLSSALKDTNNFALSRDMQFAQLAASKQFEDMQNTLKEDVDYLSSIETNTANTSTAINNLSEVMKAFLMGGAMPSFAVGTSYVSNDMTARIHQGEIITPKNFSDGLRNGDLVMGQTSGIINAISIMNNNFTQNVANLENKLNSIISLSNGQLNRLIDIRDINNESLVTLGNIEVII